MRLEKIAWALGIIVWITFLVSLSVAIALGRNAPLIFPESILDIVGITVLPLLTIIALFKRQIRRWRLPVVVVSYIVATQLFYPWLVRLYLKNHPGDPGMHWEVANFPDYQYIENDPVGDPQYAGQVNVMPPYFDIPAQRPK